MSDEAKVVAPTTAGEGASIDPRAYVDGLVQEIGDRPLDTVVALVLDKHGRVTLHSSTGNIERVIAMLHSLNAATTGIWEQTVVNAGQRFAQQQQETPPDASE